MKAKMIQRIKNYAGNPKPKLAVRVKLHSENGVSQGEGIFPAHPNKPVKVQVN